MSIQAALLATQCDTSITNQVRHELVVTLNKVVDKPDTDSDKVIVSALLTELLTYFPAVVPPGTMAVASAEVAVAEVAEAPKRRRRKAKVEAKTEAKTEAS